MKHSAAPPICLSPFCFDQQLVATATVCQQKANVSHVLHHPPPTTPSPVTCTRNTTHHPPPTTHHPSSIHHLQSQPPKSIMDQLEAERKPLLCIIPSVVRTPILWLIFDILAELNHFSSRIEKPAPLQTRLGFENNPQAYRTFRVHYLSFKLTVGLVASSYDR